MLPLMTNLLKILLMILAVTFRFSIKWLITLVPIEDKNQTVSSTSLELIQMYSF